MCTSRCFEAADKNVGELSAPFVSRIPMSRVYLRVVLRPEYEMKYKIEIPETESFFLFLFVFVSAITGEFFQRKFQFCAAPVGVNARHGSNTEKRKLYLQRCLRRCPPGRVFMEVDDRPCIHSDSVYPESSARKPRETLELSRRPKSPDLSTDNSQLSPHFFSTARPNASSTCTHYSPRLPDSLLLLKVREISC